MGRGLAIYTAGGVAAFLAPYVPTGKPGSLAPDVRASLEQALRRPDGFASDEARRQGVARTPGVQITYKTLYPRVRTRFRAKLKRPRPSHPKKRCGTPGSSSARP